MTDWPRLIPFMPSPIKPQDWRTLLASLIQFGRSQDGTVERDLTQAIENAIHAARCEGFQEAINKSQ